MRSQIEPTTTPVADLQSRGSNKTVVLYMRGPLSQGLLLVNFEEHSEFPYVKLDMMDIPGVHNMTAFVEGYPRKCACNMCDVSLLFYRNHA